MSADAKQSRFQPTTKQWLFAQECADLLAAGQSLNQKQIAQRIGVQPTTISIWKRNLQFMEWWRGQLVRAMPVLAHRALGAICEGVLRGSPTHIEAFVAIAGQAASVLAFEWFGVDAAAAGFGAGPGGPRGGATAAAQASVTVVGLPMPPTRAEAEARRPPAGSTEIRPPFIPPGLQLPPKGEPK